MKWLAEITSLLAMAMSFAAASVLHAETITVAAAVSLKETVTEIASNYEREQGVEVKFVFGSSGQLAAQIKAGAPIDLFISAAVKQMDDLEKAQFVEKGSSKTIAGNALVLIVPAESKLKLDGFAGLAGPEVKRVAIGNPKTVPAGQYAQQALASLKIDETLKDRLVYGANVRQVLDYVERGEVEAGIVYQTDAKQSGEKIRTVAIADAAWHEPIVYPSAVVRDGSNRESARRFLDYLQGESAKAVLRRQGFATEAR